MATGDTLGTDPGAETPPRDRAETATMQSLLNCYLHELGGYDLVSSADAPVEFDCDRCVRLPLPAQGVTVYVPLRYRSLTDRHLFGGAGVSVDSEGRTLDLDYLTLARLLVTDLSERRDAPGATDELLSRVVQSCHNTARTVAARRGDEDALYGFETTFREAEQSLVFGHHRHPTPKSRQGISEHDAPRYVPELRGSFRLHYFRVAPDLLAHDSARDRSATEWIDEELRADPAVPDSFVADHVASEDGLVPVHPWQADYLTSQPGVRERLGDGIESLGQVGREFSPTSSVRTLYAPEAEFMLKGSLNVEITNSARVNKRHELERGVAVAELLDAGLRDVIDSEFDDFDLLDDPAFLTVDLGETESGFETVLRENPFRGETARNATPVVALCQNPIGDGHSRLGTLVATLAEREGRPTAEVAVEWFRRYFSVGLRPVLWLYLRYGFGVEAHQQNSVVLLDEGYPTGFRYRDNQGFYFPESRYDRLDGILPGVGDRTDTICGDDIADQRMCYWTVLNNAFGVIATLGKSGLVGERRLLAVLREELRSLRAVDHDGSSLLDSLLTESALTRQSNFLTRFHDIDELADSVESASVFVDVPNPLVTAFEEPAGDDSPTAEQSPGRRID
jgi:siderophore synthetase component